MGGGATNLFSAALGAIFNTIGDRDRQIFSQNMLLEEADVVIGVDSDSGTGGTVDMTIGAKYTEFDE